MLQRGTDFVGKLFTIDARTTATSARGVSALNHETGNDTVKDDIVVVSALGEGRKVLACLGGVVIVKLDRDGTLSLISMASF